MSSVISYHMFWHYELSSNWNSDYQCSGSLVKLKFWVIFFNLALLRVWINVQALSLFILWGTCSAVSVVATPFISAAPLTHLSSNDLAQAV